MLSGKALRLLLDKFMKSEVAKNKILGARESHRIALTISRANGASLGKVMKKIS